MIPGLTLCYIVLIAIIIIYWHGRQLQLLKKCNQSCKYCKKAYKTCSKVINKPVHRLNKTEQKIIDEMKKLNRKEQEDPKKLHEDKKAIHNISDDEIDKAIAVSHGFREEEDEERARNVRTSINRLYMDSICPGDDRLYKKAQDVAIRNRDAINNRCKFDRNSLSPYVSEELVDNENRDWWCNDRYVV